MGFSNDSGVRTAFARRQLARQTFSTYFSGINPYRGFYCFGGDFLQRLHFRKNSRKRGRVTLQ